MTLTADPSQSARPSVWFSELAVLIYLAAATVIVHLLTGGQYGFHRDELATLDDARHLAVIWRGALSRTPQRSSFSSGFVSGTYVGGSFSSPRNRMVPQLHPNGWIK